MKIEKNSAVKIHYTLHDKDGNLLDSSVGKEPLSYIHGMGMIIKGLEEKLEGMEAGAKFNAVIDAKDAYGEYNPSLVCEVPRSQFETDMPIEIGMAFQAGTPDGQMIIVHVTKVTDETITVDGNHELAGKQLTFDIEVVEVREATEEELSGGCGCGGCGGCGSECGGCGDDCGCGGCGE